VKTYFFREKFWREVKTREGGEKMVKKKKVFLNFFLGGGGGWWWWWWWWWWWGVHICIVVICGYSSS